MTTSQPIRPQPRRTERRSIPPFGDGNDPNALSILLDRLLEKCRFTPFVGNGILDNDTYFLAVEEAQKPIEPQFVLTIIGLPELNKSIAFQKDDLVLGLSVRSPHLRTYAVVEQWPVDNIPQGPWSPDSRILEGLQTGRGMDFVLSVQVAASRPELITQGLNPGKVLCRKVFSVKENIDSFTFPFEWVEFGGDSGYPEEALWVLEWKPSDDDDPLQRPVDEVLIVRGNKKAEESLIVMGQVQGADELAWRMMAAEITTQIWADVLAKTDVEPDEGDTETLAGQVFARLADISGLPYPEIKGLAGQDDSLTDLRNLVARVLKVVT